MPLKYESAQKNALKPWDTSDMSRLLSMMIDGREADYIAARLGRSESATKQRMREIQEEGYMDSMKAAKAYLEELQRAATVNCLRCQKPFESYDRRKNRICSKCKEYIGNE